MEQIVVVKYDLEVIMFSVPVLVSSKKQTKTPLIGGVISCFRGREMTFTKKGASYRINVT
jgi:hypothetical protein